MCVLSNLLNIKFPVYTWIALAATDVSEEIVSSIIFNKFVSLLEANIFEAIKFILKYIYNKNEYFSSIMIFMTESYLIF